MLFLPVAYLYLLSVYDYFSKKYNAVLDDETFELIVNCYRSETSSIESLRSAAKKYHNFVAYKFQQNFPKITTSSYINDDLDEFPPELLQWRNLMIYRVGSNTYIRRDFEETKKKGLDSDYEIFHSEHQQKQTVVDKDTETLIEDINSTFPVPTFNELSLITSNTIDIWFLKCAKFIAYAVEFPFVPNCSLVQKLHEALDTKLDQIYTSFYCLNSFPELVDMFISTQDSGKKIPHPFSITNEYSISWREKNGISFTQVELSDLDVCDWHDLVYEYKKIQTIPTLIVIMYCIYRFNLDIKCGPKFPSFIKDQVKRTLKRYPEKNDPSLTVPVPNPPATRTDE